MSDDEVVVCYMLRDGTIMERRVARSRSDELVDKLVSLGVPREKIQIAELPRRPP